MGREVAVLRAGRLAQSGTPVSVYRLPLDLDLARFVGDAVVVPGRADGSSVECVFGRLPLRRGGGSGAVQVMIRPEQIRLSTAGTASSAVGDGTAATVVGHTYYGPDTVVRLLLKDDSSTAVAAKTSDSDLPELGEAVELRVVGSVVSYPGRASTAEQSPPAQTQSELRG
jgi:iron(III) transport system ATP-binding protein